MKTVYLEDNDYNFIYSKVPRFCVDIVIKNINGGILLTKRDTEPFIGMWHAPGGRVNFRETIEDACKRISKRELGINVDFVKQLYVIELLNEYQNNNPRHSISLFCLCNTTEDVSKFNFFHEIPEHTIQQHKDFLSKYLK